MLGGSFSPMDGAALKYNDSMPSATSVYLSLINGLAKQRKKVRNGFQKDGMHDPLFCPHFDQTRNNLTVTHISQTQTLIFLLP